MHHFFATVEKEHLKAETYKDAFNYLLEQNGTKSKVVVNSMSMQQLFTHLQPAIISDSTILLSGESGVGKDVVATFIHNNSPRAKEPFIPVNCAAIPHELVESEFFGYESGAFTGASRQGRTGFFEMANNGTLFLDEIGELPFNMQSKLLRVLEDHMVARIGSKKSNRVNIRIIAATNQDLAQMVQDGAFREDLYYRLNVIPFSIPPLRERRDDIIPLAEYFLDNYNQKYGKSKRFSAEVYDVLLHQVWKGNVRELKNVVARLTILSLSDTISAKDLPLVGLDAPSRADAIPPEKPQVAAAETTAKDTSILETYQAAERERVLAALMKSNGNKTKAAKLLGMSRGKLYKLLDL